MEDFEILENLEPVEELSDKTLEESELKCVASNVSDKDVLQNSLDDVDVYIHASQLSKLMTGSFGLSSAQEKKLQEYEERTKPLTDRMAAEKKDLIDKRDNPKLGRTATSYIDEMITWNWYGVSKYMYSKYTAHGNANEDHSIHMINKYLGTNFKKNISRQNDDDWLLSGEVDIDASKELNAIIDIKNPYDTFTFDRNRSLELSDVITGVKSIDTIQSEYYWQGQAYMHLWDVENFYLIFTLNENYYMEEQNEYERFGFFDRVIVKHMVRDREAMNRYKQRIPAIKNAIIDAKIRRYESFIKTHSYIDNMKKQLNKK